MISGGGTGGHIYPAIAIAEALKELTPSVDILFVGAKGKMEMKKVPEAGFRIEGLWISGIQRTLSAKNLLFPVKLLASLMKAFRLIRQFRPDAVVGVGGYASGPLLYAAGKKKIPTLIQEQNSYAGLTNKWLSGMVTKICVAHEGMDKYFPSEKLVVTGNPVRKAIVPDPDKKKEAYQFFGFSEEKKTLMVLGGSLGARSLNECMVSGYRQLADSGFQVIWQTGGYYYEEMRQRIKNPSPAIRMMDFLREMNHGYAVADVVISRAGALSLAELMQAGKPCILVPSPNVAEDHQSKNAQALVERGAALLVKDSEASEKLIPEGIRLLRDEVRCAELSRSIRAMAHPQADISIAKEILKMIA